MTEEENALSFLGSIAGREVFQRVTRNEVVDRVLSVIAANDRPRFADLCSALVMDAEIDATEQEATRYLDQLLKIGLLTLRNGVAEQDAEWDVPLVRELEGIDDLAAAAIVELLRSLRERVTAFAEANSARRAQISREAQELIASCFETLGIANAVKQGMPFFEDATADAAATIPCHS